MSGIRAAGRWFESSPGHMDTTAVPDFVIRHAGLGAFEAVHPDGRVQAIGPSMGGMLRYTYFEDYTLPPDGWQVTHREFLPAYHGKVFRDMTENPGKFRRRDDGSFEEGHAKDDDKAA